MNISRNKSCWLFRIFVVFVSNFQHIFQQIFTFLIVSTCLHIEISISGCKINVAVFFSQNMVVIFFCFSLHKIMAVFLEFYIKSKSKKGRLKSTNGFCGKRRCWNPLTMTLYLRPVQEMIMEWMWWAQTSNIIGDSSIYHRIRLKYSFLSINYSNGRKMF